MAVSANFVNWCILLLVVSRTENRRKTLLALSDASVELFSARGLAVTFDEVAAAAGISARTAFRYVSIKEELAFIHQILWLDAFDAALAALPPDPDRPIRERLWTGVAAVADLVDAAPKGPRSALQLVVALPELSRGRTLVFDRWVERLYVECLSIPETPDERFRARVLASAAMGVLDATALEWALNKRRARFRTVLTSAFGQLEPMLEPLAK